MASRLRLMSAGRSSSPADDAFEPAARRVLAVFREIHGAEGWCLPEVSVGRRGRDVAVRLGSREIVGRLSAHSLLAGRVWAEILAPGYPRPFSQWLPGTDPQDWDRSARAEPGRIWARENLVAEDLFAAGLAFLELGEPEEGRLCLRRALRGCPTEPRGTEAPESAVSHLEEPVAQMRAALAWRESLEARLPVDLRDAALRRTQAEEVTATKSRWGLEGAVRAVVLPFHAHADPVERAGAAAALDSICEEIAASDPARLHRLSGAALLALLRDDEPWVREPALEAALVLAHRLKRDRRYEPALPLLDELLAEGVARRELLAWRFECRLGTGDPAGAEADWAEVEALRDLPPHRAIEVRPGRYDRDPAWSEFRLAAEARARAPRPAKPPPPARSREGGGAAASRRSAGRPEAGRRPGPPRGR